MDATNPLVEAVLLAWTFLASYATVYTAALAVVRYYASRRAVEAPLW